MQILNGETCADKYLKRITERGKTVEIAQALARAIEHRIRAAETAEFRAEDMIRPLQTESRDFIFETRQLGLLAWR